MTSSHRGARAGELRILLSEYAPGKRTDLQFVDGSCQSAAEVIIGPGVAPWKSWTAVAQDGGDLTGRYAPPQQLFRDPFVGDAPVRLGEAFENPQTVQPLAVDAGRARNGLAISQAGIGGVVGCNRRNPTCGQRQIRGAGPAVFGLFQQSGSLRGQAGMGVQHLDPGEIAAAIAPLRLSVGVAGQPAQVTPIGAGQVAAIGVSQQLAGITGNGRLDREGAHVHPGLQIAGAGLKHHTGAVSVAQHGLEDRRVAVIQIHENVAGIAVWGVGLNVDVAPFPVTSAQKSDRRGISQLCGRPQAFTRKGPSGLTVDETDEVKVVRHGGELAAHGLHGEMESKIEHGPNSRTDGAGSTITFQRTVISGLTGCLSLGVHPKSSRDAMNPLPCPAQLNQVNRQRSHYVFDLAARESIVLTEVAGTRGTVRRLDDNPKSAESEDRRHNLNCTLNS